MFAIKLRSGLFGLLAMLIVGAFSAAPAFAESGPFCYHKAVGTEGKGEKIKAGAPEEVQGNGGEQVLTGKVGGLKNEITSEGVQVKGIMYNNALQCQLKLELKYHSPKLKGFPTCEVKVGTNNIVKLVGHQDWKWDGTKNS